MEKDALVYVDLDGVPLLAGRLWTRVRKNKEGATIEYGDSWLKHPNRFSLEPALKLGPSILAIGFSSRHNCMRS